jgi:hypothetical protein
VHVVVSAGFSATVHRKRDLAVQQIHPGALELVEPLRLKQDLDRVEFFAAPGEASE